MTRAWRENDVDLVLARGERVAVEVKRSFTPMWIGLALGGVLLLVFGMQDPVYGWGVMFLGMVVLALVGGAAQSKRWYVTDRRLLRTGYQGGKAHPLAGGRLHRERGRFGERLTVTLGDERVVLRHVTNADDVAGAIERGAAAPPRHESDAPAPAPALT